MAFTLLSLHEFPEAERLLRDVLKARRRDLPPGDHTTLLTLTDLARTLEAQRKYGEAEELAREAVLIVRNTKNYRVDELCGCLMLHGGLLTRMNRGAQALPLLREALSSARAALPPGNSLIGSIETTLGSLLVANGKFPEAEPLLLSGARAVLNNRAASLNDRRAVIERVLELYKKSGQAQKAEPWRLKRLDVQFPSNPFAR